VSSPHISRADVEHVARLARLALTEEETDELAGQLGSILEHAQDIAALDTDGVPPTSHPLPVRNVVRLDEVRRPLPRDEVLAEAPEVEDGRFRVPPVLGEEP
jgi:aspartyl-tRNA(Asn)/glutamyl-tRNA(Gln) amidotransferase subunit C